MLGRFLKQGTGRKGHRDLFAPRLVQYSRNWILDAVLLRRHVCTPVPCYAVGNSVATMREGENTLVLHQLETRVTLCTIENTPTVHITGTVRYWYCTFHQFSPKDPDSAEEHLLSEFENMLDDRMAVIRTAGMRHEMGNTRATPALCV